ncbi:hypothetical protein T492DRAFT_896800 [Pavlovales sp. CCMP2436]|nr:hypothetical protein T492DRAFT_896800 [Pavlovales sp. CCMP2436]
MEADPAARAVGEYVLAANAKEIEATTASAALREARAGGKRELIDAAARECAVTPLLANGAAGAGLGDVSALAISVKAPAGAAANAKRQLNAVAAGAAAALAADSATGSDAGSSAGSAADSAAGSAVGAAAGGAAAAAGWVKLLVLAAFDLCENLIMQSYCLVILFTVSAQFIARTHREAITFRRAPTMQVTEPFLTRELKYRKHVVVPEAFAGSKFYLASLKPEDKIFHLHGNCGTSNRKREDDRVVFSNWGQTGRMIIRILDLNEAGNAGELPPRRNFLFNRKVKTWKLEIREPFTIEEYNEMREQGSGPPHHVLNVHTRIAHLLISQTIPTRQDAHQEPMLTHLDTRLAH